MSTDVRADDGRETPGGATLVLAPGVSAQGGQVCTDYLADADAALVVSLRRPPAAWLDSRGDVPATWFVSTEQHPDSVRGVTDPGDLTGVGIAVSEFLDGLPADATPAVCVDSLTTLLQYSSPERTYRFLQVLCGRVLAADG
ncbi:MAG: hypothetical protein ABEH83_11655, partial [Halobacterium sp.]